MNSTDKFVAVFGMVPDNDEESLINVVTEAMKNGFAIVLCKPGNKTPLCILNNTDRNRADREAQNEAAKLTDAEGKPLDGLWHKRSHACGIYHALTMSWVDPDPEKAHKKVKTKVGTVVRRLTKMYGKLNIGVHLGLSRMLVVDLDTTAEADGFRRDWVKQLSQMTPESSRDHVIPVPNMTVKSPGKKDQTGNWIHQDGGHYWFTIPDDVELPKGQEAIRTDGNWVAMWGDHQVLVPPSVRSEGTYRIIGQSMEAPDWLIAQILHETESRMVRVANRGPLPDGAGDIDQWSAVTPWNDLLLPDDWQETRLPDRCSCPIWTAPGLHGSYKSATAHDVGCSKYDSSPGHAPLHVWTDNPPDFIQEWFNTHNSRTLTKIQYVAARDYAGNVSETLVGMGFNYAKGIAPDLDFDLGVAPEVFNPDAPKHDFVYDDLAQLPGTSTPIGPSDAPVSNVDMFGDLPAIASSEESSEAPTEGQEGEPGDASVPPAGDTDEDSWKRIPLDSDDDEPDQPPSLMPRSDYDAETGEGICLLYPGLVHALYAEPESGKSWVMLYEALRIAKCGGIVLILDFENTWRQVKQRLLAMGAIKKDLARIDFRAPSAAPRGDSAWWAGIFATGYTLIVLDGMNYAMNIFGKSYTDNTDVTWFMRNLPTKLARKTGAAVVIIDHQGKDSEKAGKYAMGGIMKAAGIDGASYIVQVISPLARGRIGKIGLLVGRDKPGFVKGKVLAFDDHMRGHIAVFNFDARLPQIKVSLDPPDDPMVTEDVLSEPENRESDPEVEIWVLKALESSGPDGLDSVRKIIGRINDLRVSKEPDSKGFRTQKVTDAIENLCVTGEIMRAEDPGNGRARMHQVTRIGRARIEP